MSHESFVRHLLCMIEEHQRNKNNVWEQISRMREVILKYILDHRELFIVRLHEMFTVNIINLNLYECHCLLERCQKLCSECLTDFNCSYLPELVVENVSSFQTDPMESFTISTDEDDEIPLSSLSAVERSQKRGKTLVKKQNVSINVTPILKHRRKQCLNPKLINPDLTHLAKSEEVDLTCSETSIKQTLTCLICMDRETSHILFPCYHLVTCEICANSLKHCPVCQKYISRRHKVYY